ncbi:unconventional myosin-VIIa-like [Scleropages formosus]|uniref:Unconventional myosin-VIIa-like n=1 Tax=Scleropages formosus TaxID=113540 RepID=A0A0N8K300_SCLFO|nr:unconventional myosin-VIIa-like [Scleropages formosus]
MVVFGQGDYVWFDNNSGVPIGAQVKVLENGQRQLVDDEGKVHKVTKKKEESLRPMHPTSVEGVDDMICLGDLNEAGLLRNLLVRHRGGIIYTYTGSILMAMNPYQLLPIYTAEHVHLYRNRRLGELPPHVFAIADSCYYNMYRNQRDQCCIISGESGAGKTESTKLILQFLAAVSGQHSWIEQQVLEANPILEAFGNAKTIRNDNSSRFGKYIDINFNKAGAIEGARVEQYLLEKSRVCHQMPEERNYHIFYCILLGMPAEQKKILSLGSATEYNYLTMGNCTSCDGRDDTADYNHIRSAMKILTFREKETWEIFKLLAALLHLGNMNFKGESLVLAEVIKVLWPTLNLGLREIDIYCLHIGFRRTVSNNLETCDIQASLHLNMASNLLEVDTRNLETSLTHRSFMTNRERVTKPLNSEQAADSRDAFAKAIYGRLFVWIVGKINSAIYKAPSGNDRNSHRSIGLLDIFGFENFDINSDSTMLNKMAQVHRKNNLFLPPKSSHDMEFGIQHFAGVVYYDATDFLEKNRDALSSDLIKLVETSSNKFLREIFQAELNSIALIARPNGRILVTPKNSLRHTPDMKRQTPTLCGQFRQSLESLMKTLSVCQPYFIRCFKPNDHKKPKVFDRELCMSQLRYSGMTETIRIRKMGYPIRHTFQEFLQRYRVLLRTSICDPKTEPVDKCCDCICKAYIRGEGDWKIGKTKIFLKDFHDSLLEIERDREIRKKAVLIQRVLQVYNFRKQFVNKRRAALVLQKHWRGYSIRKQYRVVQIGFERLQARVRARQLQLQYDKKRAAAIVLQARIRGYVNRKDWKSKREAAVVLQAHIRGLLARKAVTKIRKNALLSAQEREAQEQAAMELQRKLEEVLRQSQKEEENSKSETISEEKMLENIFRFLPPNVGGQEGSAPEESEDREGSRIMPEEINLDEIPTVEETPKEEVCEADDEYSFAKFASAYFQGSATHSHIRQRLRNPLLPHEDEGDALACLTIWWLILRFMGDIPEPKQAQDKVPSAADQSIQQNLGQRQGRRLSSLVGLDHKLLRGKKKGGFRDRRPSAIPEEGVTENPSKPVETVREEEEVFIGEGPTLHRPMSSLEKLHIIVGYAIVRKNIRDEIYCQICKQLVGNDNPKSVHRGWYLQSFIRSGPAGHSQYCLERLRRTLTNGNRSEPPCWRELQAAENKKPMVLSVTLTDGQSINLTMDSATNSAEICQEIAQNFNLKDTFGFSVYVSLYEKLWSLGSGKQHVMDAISQCEQEVKRRGEEEQHAPWRLYFRKEIFTPWHDCSQDPISTNLIYKQIIHGLKQGEYQSDKEDDYIQLAAKHFYVQFGADASDENAKKVVQECMNITLIETKSQAKLAQHIKTEYLKGPYIKSNRSADTVKAEVVDYAHLKWSMSFSKFFEVEKSSGHASTGPDLLKDKMFATVNCSGISFRDDKEVLQEFPFPEITGVDMISDGNAAVQFLSLTTLKGNITLCSSSVEEMGQLVGMFLEGLKERSHYAVALQDSSRQDDPTFLSVKKGDMLFLIKDSENLHNRGWIKGKNERTGLTGAISVDAILILPILNKPTNELLSLLNLPSEKKNSVVQTTQGGETTVDRVAPVSLKEFSFEYFRQPGKDRSKGGAKEKLWACSQEPLRQPLLKRLEGNSELCQQACLCFTDILPGALFCLLWGNSFSLTLSAPILKYMGDYPTKLVRSPLELTDQIFGPAMQNEDLRDEVFCQIMRQMTNNHNRMSMNNGWQLLWLCCGLFPPSQALLRYTLRFLETRPREPLASECLKRMKGMMRMEPRKRAPHQVEVDAIQQNSTQIFHKVHFPNETEEIFEVTTTTRIRDLCRNIAAKLLLASADGFSLFVKTTDRVQSLNDTDYFFDSLKQITDNPKKSKKPKDVLTCNWPFGLTGIPTNMPYLVFFMRKLWFNVIPGRDLQADFTFHFPQELPKYLRGYHKCSKEDMVNLAGFLFRVKVDTDRSQFVMIPKMLKDLVPADQMRIMSAEEWKKHIINAYNKQAGMSVDESKVEFLRAICRWPTFGCAFFEVKQTSEPSFPSIIMIAISKQGVLFIHPKTKEVLATHPFNRITNWFSGSTYFHITIGNLVNGSTILCETSLGYKIDDLLQSYINMYHNERTVLPRNNFFSS